MNDIKIPNAQIDQDLEAQAFQKSREKFEEKVQELMIARGFSRNKAVRVLEKKCQKELDKLIKRGRKRQEQLRKEGKLVDTSDLREELDRELEEQLKAQEIVLDIETHNYEPPTRDF